MTRYIVPVKPCDKCGSQMGICETDPGYDIWGISTCTNKECKGWKDAKDLLSDGGVVRYK